MRLEACSLGRVKQMIELDFHRPSHLRVHSLSRTMMATWRRCRTLAWFDISRWRCWGRLEPLWEPGPTRATSCNPEALAVGGAASSVWEHPPQPGEESLALLRSRSPGALPRPCGGGALSNRVATSRALRLRCAHAERPRVQSKESRFQ